MNWIIKVGSVCLGLGFGAGILATAKAGKAKDKIKDRFSTVDTAVVEFKLRKGVNIDDCKLVVCVPVQEEAGEAKPEKKAKQAFTNKSEILDAEVIEVAE